MAETDTITHVDGAENQAGPQTSDAPEITPAVQPGEGETKEEPKIEPVKPAVPETKAEPKAEESKIEPAQKADSDRELARLRQQVAQMTLQQELQQMQEQEKAAVAIDNKALEAGEITETEVRQRAAARDDFRRIKWQNTQLQRQAAEITTQAEERAYVLVAGKIAENLGKEEGLVDADIRKLTEELLSSKTRFSHPAEMEAAALRLLNKRHREALRKATTKSENYDKGPGAQPTGNTSDDYLIQKAGDGKPLSSAERTRLKTLLGV